MILSDNETKVDLLNNEPIAKTIIAVLKERPDHPITIGVHGDWGAGKSSVLEMVEAALSGDEKVLCLKFNGWRFQGFEDAKIALIEGVVTGLLEQRPFLTKADDAVKNVFKKIDLLKLAKRGGGLVAAAFGFFSGNHQLGMMGALAALEGTLTTPDAFTRENVGKIIDGTKDLFKEKDNEKTGNVPEEITEFRKAFDELLSKANIGQLIVLVDDLDRCLPETAIETLEAIRLFIFTSRTAFIIAADEAMIEYSVRKHFPELPDSTGPQTYARNYLEKLIQVPFRIPALGHAETRIYVTLLLVGAELSEGDPAFDRLIEAARKLLMRPWLGGVLDATAVATALNDKAKEKKTQNALIISEQVGPILASGTRGNPRQIKRFLNTLLLRQVSADARGFGEDVKLPVLAKLMLAERFLSRVFDQVAMVAVSRPDGRCPDLELLEAAARKPPQVESSKQDGKTETAKKTAGKEQVEPEPSAILGEWLVSQGAMEWAKLEPSIAQLDLRPYLFVTKDRKDYFGAATSLGQVATIADKLMGSKLVVQGELASLRKLATPEAAQVFDLIASRIIASDNFMKAPDGAAGLEVLVQAHPSLQTNLLDFFERLPLNRLGPWVCTGWTSALRDPEAIKRFDQLLETWSKDGSATLKTAAANIIRTRTQGMR